MSSNYLEVRFKDRTAIVQLNRPEKRNALNSEMASAIKQAFEALNTREDIRSIVIKGHQEAFCAGADLQYLQKLQAFSREENEADSRNLKEMFQTIYNSPKVTIAQVEGPALAGGCGLTAVCDYVFASPNAMFGYTESKIGFIPAIVMVYVLRKFGEGLSRHYLMSGKVIGAEEAQKIGWVFQVLPQEELEEKVLEFANQLALKSSGQSIQGIKEMIAKVQELTLEDALEYAVKSNAIARETRDCKSGIQSFLEKKKILW